ncbi:MAG: prolyl oligopeptidase family serine peptidase [Agarilytica sp.]
MKKIGLILGLGILVLAQVSIASKGSIKVGVEKLSLSDPERRSWDGKSARPITTHIFYPTLESREEPLLIGPPKHPMFKAGHVVWSGVPVTERKLPLIVMSHGTGGSALTLLWLAEAFVKQGYIVVGVNHHGNTALEKKKYAQGYTLWWEQARDLAIVTENILESKAWSKKIDHSKIGVMGFSLGGYTTIATLGGHTDRKRFEGFCNSKEKDFTCEPQKEFPNMYVEFEAVKNTPQVKLSLSREKNDYSINQFKAGYVIAPAVVQVFTPESLANINHPVSIAVGANDRTTPAGTNAKWLHKNIPESRYKEIENVSHYTFLPECGSGGKKILPHLCNDHETVNRRSIHNEVAGDAVAFFNEVFGL